MVFDDEVHNLMDMLTLPEGWEEYVDITVLYSSNYIAYEEYKGYDAGDGLKWYLARGAGAYQFRIAIKSGINTNANNPSVVWLKPESGDDDNEQPGTPEELNLYFILRNEDNRFEEPEEEYEELEELEEENYESPETECYEESAGGSESTEPEAPADGKPGEGEIAPPDPEDRLEELKGWVLEIQRVTVGVDKLIVKAMKWNETDSTSTLEFNYNPLGLTVIDPKKVEELFATALYYEILDTEGNVIFTSDDRDVTKLKEGCTYFVHPVIRDRYKDYIEIEYEDDVKRQYDFWIMEGAIEDYIVVVDKPLPPYSLGTKEYTGEELEFVLDVLQKIPGLKKVEAISDGLKQTNVGKYTVTVCFADGNKYCWSKEGGAINREAIEYVFEITAKKINITESELESAKYTGEEIDIGEKLKELLGEDIMEYITVTNSAMDNVNAGTRTLTITIKGIYRGNVVWGDETTINADGTVTINWEIEKAQIGGTWNNLGRLDIESDSYKGGAEGKIEYTYVDKATGEAVDFSAMEKGKTYVVTATIIDTDNLEWKPGFSNTHEFVLLVDLITLPKPTLVRDAISYTGQSITFEISEYESKYAEYIEVIGSLTQTKVGDYSVTIRIKSEGTLWDTGSTDEVKLYFSVTRAIINGTWIEGAGVMSLTSSYRYSYDKIVRYTYTQGETVVDKKDLKLNETYTVTVTLIDTENFEFAEGVELTKEFVFTKVTETIEGYPAVDRPFFTYTGNAITFTIQNWSYYSQFLEIVGSLRFTEAGQYTIVLKIRDDVLAQWEDGTKRDFEIKVEIGQVELVGEWQDNGTVKFQTNSYMGTYSGVVEYVYYEEDGVTPIALSELQEGKTYVAEIKLVDEKNFKFGEFDKTYKFTFKNDGNVIAKLGWWVYLLIGIVALLLIVIIIFIIIVIVKRRKNEDENAGNAEGTESGDGNVADDNYGDGADDYGTDEGYEDGEYDNDDAGSDDVESDDYGTDYDYGDETDGTGSDEYGGDDTEPYEGDGSDDEFHS